jgi:glycosyltransferase involved in cell wall biosynthesis
LIPGNKNTEGKSATIMPKVSAIIPTRNRPQVLERAIRSVLAQSFQDFEIIVVIDGPDETTKPAVLEAMDPRISTLSLPANVGLAEARNEGIRRASGKWIALLDDDDEWLPEKLRLQTEKASAAGGQYVFVPCRFIEKSLTLERVMPMVLPHSAERFSEYIYCEGGYLQPSMYFMSRALVLEIPFTKGLRHVEDTDWLLRMARHPSVQIASVAEPLSIYYNLKTGNRESETTPWNHPLSWAIDRPELFTRKAFPFFAARLCVNARKAGEPLSVLMHLFSQARKYGDISCRSFSYFLAYWFLPDGALKSLRRASRRALDLRRQLPWSRSALVAERTGP